MRTSSMPTPSPLPVPFETKRIRSCTEPEPAAPVRCVRTVCHSSVLIHHALSPKAAVVPVSYQADPTPANGAPPMLHAAVTSAGISDLLDHVFSIEDVGIYKPDGSVYQIAVDRLGCAPAQICFMSSNAWDVAGAAHFGFSVVWINRFGQVPERLPGTPVEQLSSLDALPGLLGF